MTIAFSRLKLKGSRSISLATPPSFTRRARSSARYKSDSLWTRRLDTSTASSNYAKRSTQWIDETRRQSLWDREISLLPKSANRHWVKRLNDLKGRFYGDSRLWLNVGREAELEEREPIFQVS